MDRRGAIGTAAILLTLAIAGCVAPAPPSRPPVSPAPTGSPGPIPTVAATSLATAPATPPAVPTLAPGSTSDLAVTCDSATDLAFPLTAIEGIGASELAPDPAASALRAYLAQDGGLMPDTGWHRVVQTPRTAAFLARDTMPGAWAMVIFVANGPNWDLDLNGGCTLQTAVPKGFSLATWELDPTRPPLAADRVVTVLATETACSSGKPPGDRMQPPTVVVRGDTVVITLIVRHRPGGQDCPGNPAVPVKVDLGQALGDRRLVDGAFPEAVPK